MNATLTRSRVSVASVVVVALALPFGSAFAVPSDKQAWQSQKAGVTVFHDELDPAIFWFVPKIRFESANGKTVLRPRTLANGNVEYTTRIVPYFSDPLRELVVENVLGPDRRPAIRHQSQLKPVVAKNIGVALPDFGYKYTSESVTNYEYLNVPRLVRFQLDPDEAALFEDLLGDPYGVTTTFTVVYDSVVSDKYYQISVSCKDLYQALSQAGGAGGGLSVGKKVHVGASIEGAYRKAVQNNLGGVEIVSKGELPAMEETLRTTLEYCFEPLDEYGRHGYSDENRDDLCRGEDDCLDPSGRDADLMPKVAAKGKYRFRKEVENDEKQVGVKHMNHADAVNTTVVMGSIKRDAPAVDRPGATDTRKTLVVRSANTAVAPLAAGLRVEPGTHYTIRAEYVVKVRGKSVTLDASVPRLDGDLYYRIGLEDWRPVGRQLAIGSDIARSGALEFYLDVAAARSRLPARLKIFGQVPEPEFTVQIVAKKFDEKLSLTRPK